MGAAIWPADTSVPQAETTVGEALRGQAAATPDRAALLWPRGRDVASTSYGELLAAATAGARALLDVVVPGERVAVWAPNRTEWVVLEYAAALAGTPLVPLNPALTDVEAGHIIGQSGARVVLAIAEWRGRPLLDRATWLARDAPDVRVVTDLATWCAHGHDGAGAPLPEVAPADPFLLQYTSGTTGRPKGAVLSHRAAYNCARFSALALDPEPAEVWCTPLPLHHVGGSVSTVLGVLSIGATFALVPDYVPELVLDILERTGATHAGLVPTMCLDLLAVADFDDRARRLRLQRVMGGGSTVPPELVRRIERKLGVRMVIGYGQSESPSITQTSLDDSDEDKAATIGRPLPHREVRITRPGTSEPVSFGERGELCVRSPLVMDGYHELPEATAQALDADGWLHTGDLCAMDERGVVTILGRVRDVIIRGGENVYPREVEEAILAHPGVADVAVVGAPHVRFGEQVAAFVRPSPGAAVTAADLMPFARRSLAPFKVPSVWRFVDELPLTASGKVKKYELRKQLT